MLYLISAIIIGQIVFDYFTLRDLRKAEEKLDAVRRKADFCMRTLTEEFEARGEK